MAEYLLTPGPVPMHPEAVEALARQPVSHRSQGFRELLSSVLEKLATIYGGGEPLLLTGSGTLAVESMAWSLVAPGERVLVLVSGEFGERLAETLRRRGALVEEVRAAAPGEPADLGEALSRLEKGGYAAVAMVYTETSMGLSHRYAEKIAEEAKSRGALVLVDAVSALAGEEVPAPPMVDAVASASQKALAGPPGLSFVAVSEEALKKMKRVEPRPPTYMDLWKVYKFHSERRETPFTPAIQLLYGMEVALEKVLEYGLDRWIERHRRRARLLYEKLPAAGLEPLVHDPGYRANTVTAFRTPVPSSVVAEKLLEKGYRVARGMGALKDTVVRISTMGWLGDEVYHGLVEAIAGLL